MPIYQCDKCDFRTRRKDAMSYHLGRKFPCPNQIVKVNADIMTLIHKEGIEVIKIAQDFKMDLNKIVDYGAESD